MRYLLLLSFILFASVAYSENEKPNNPGSKGQGQKAASQQPPVVVNVLPPTKSKEEAEHEAQERKEKAELDRKLVEWTADLARYTADLASFTRVLAVVAAFQLIVFAYQGWQLKRTVDSADKNAIIELRAYVHIHHVRLMQQLDPKVITNLDVVIRNSGKTPARRVTAWGATHLMEFPPLSDLPGKPTGPRPAQFNIAADAMVGQNNLSARAPTLEEINAIRDGTMVLYAYGEIRYYDVFDKERITQYRYACGGSYGPAEGNLWACEKGNETT